MEVTMNRTVLLLLFLALPLVTSGCVATTGSQNLGGIKESGEVTKMYRSYTINPNYNYCYSGVELQPDAIMGIDKIYTVQSKFWHPVDLTEEQLKKWVVWGDRESEDSGFSRRYMGRYMGAYILDLQGKVVGDWYSKKDWGIFEFPGNNVIVPHPPRNKAGSDYYRF